MLDMVADIATNRGLSSLTIELYGAWESGKYSLMSLAKQMIEEKTQKRRKE